MTQAVMESDAFTCLFAGLGFVGLLVWSLAVWRAGNREVARLERRFQRAATRCPACGYDLRGVAYVRCPECGRAVDGLCDSVWSAEGFDVLRLHEDLPRIRIDPIAPEPGERLVFVYLTPNAQLAGLLVDQFNARGVWCRVHLMQHSEHVGEYGAPVELHRLDVAEADKERANLILGEFQLRPATNED